MYKAKVAVCSDIRTKHSTQSECHVEFLNVKSWWYVKKPLGFKRLRHKPENVDTHLPDYTVSKPRDQNFYVLHRKCATLLKQRAMRQFLTKGFLKVIRNSSKTLQTVTKHSQSICYIHDTRT